MSRKVVIRLVPTSKPTTTIPAPSLAELGQLLAGLATAKSPSQALHQISRAASHMFEAPVSGFITNSGEPHFTVSEQSLPAAARGLINYPRDLSAPSLDHWPEAPLPAALASLTSGAAPHIRPFIWRGEPFGGLVIWSQQALAHEAEAGLQAVVAQAATTLKALLLEQTAKYSLAETITLQRLTQVITGSLDFDRVSASLLQQSRKFFRVDATALALATPDGREFFVDQAVGLSPEYVAKLRLARDSAIVKRLIKAGSPIHLHNLETTAPISHDPELARREGVRTALLAPISSAGRFVGGLILISKTPRVFSYAEIRFAESLAQHTGIAITNANLHAGLRKASNEIEQTRNLMRDGLLVFDLEHKLHYFNPAAGSVLSLGPEHLMKRLPKGTLRRLPGLKIDPNELEAAIDKALQGHVDRTQFSLETDGQTRYFEAIYSPYRDNKGTRIGVLMSIRDNTSLYSEKEKLQAIQSGLADGLILIGSEGETIDFNQEWARLFDLGLNPTGRPFFELMAERKNFTCDHDPIEMLHNVLKGKRTTCYAHDLENARHVQISLSPITISGRITGAVATARDITALIEKTVESNEMAAKAHRHLRELSQLAELSGIVGFNLTSIYQKYLAKVATLLESASAVLYLYQPGKQILARSQTIGPLYDDPQTLELSARHLAARAFTTRQSVVSTDEDKATYRLAMSITHHSKTLGVLIVSRTTGAYGDHEAKLLRLVATRLAVLVENAALYHDVNARRERWEAVFRFTEEGIVIFDRNGTIVGFNPACTQITQYHAAEAIGKPFSKIIKNVGPASVSGQLVGPIERVLEEGITIAKSEQLIENRGGSRVWTEISYSPIFDDTGRVTSGIAIIRDTTRDREVEEIKSDFISIVSHELRTPLTAIKGFLSMTLKHDFGSLSEKQFHYLSRVYQSNQRMIDLVEDLMDATYIETGKITLAIAPVALDSVVAGVVSELAAKAAATHIMINVRRRQRLPLVLADEARLHQIVLNLVDNAVKYSMPGTEVSISFRLQGDELVTTVADHGVGIGKNQIDRIFTKFGRIFNPLSVQAGGTGLGLYIVKNLIESHDGRIWVTSIEGKGSKFNFSLPVAKQLPLIE